MQPQHHHFQHSTAVDFGWSGPLIGSAEYSSAAATYRPRNRQQDCVFSYGLRYNEKCGPNMAVGGELRQDRETEYVAERYAYHGRVRWPKQHWQTG
jgi:hypothetical protein